MRKQVLTVIHQQCWDPTSSCVWCQRQFLYTVSCTIHRKVLKELRNHEYYRRLFLKQRNCFQQATTKIPVLNHWKTELKTYIPMRHMKKNKSNTVKYCFTRQTDPEVSDYNKSSYIRFLQNLRCKMRYFSIFMKKKQIIFIFH